MLSFFPRDVLDEIMDLIESVSEGFLTYFCNSENDLLRREDKKRRHHEDKLMSVRGMINIIR